MSEDEINALEKELEIEKPKEDEKAKPEKLSDWIEEESESNITPQEYDKLTAKDKQKYGI